MGFLTPKACEKEKIKRWLTVCICGHWSWKCISEKSSRRKHKSDSLFTIGMWKVKKSMCIGEVKKIWKNLISSKFFLSKKIKKIKKLRFKYWNSHIFCGLEIDIDIDIDIYICFKFFLIYKLFVLEKVLQ